MRLSTEPVRRLLSRFRRREVATLSRSGEVRFRELLESLPNIAVQGYDRNRQVVYWNEESARLYGYQKSEALGRRLEELIIPIDMREQVIALHEAWIREGRAIPAGRLILHDRACRPVPVYSYHVMLGDLTRDPVMFCVDVPVGSEISSSRSEWTPPAPELEAP